MDVSKVSDYGIDGCEAAVASIKEGVAAQSTGGTTGVEEMGLEEGLALLGLYPCLHARGPGRACPADALGNDEFDFFGAMG